MAQINSSNSFQPERRIAVPKVDVVSWTFATYGDYDVDRPIYIDAADQNHSYSARQARSMIRQLVSGFKACGLETGDCVCIHSFNNIAYPIIWLGAIGAGGCVSGSNPGYTSLEIEHHLKISQAKFVITQPESLPDILQAARGCEIPDSRIFILAPPEQHVSACCRSWEELLLCGESDWAQFDDERAAEETIAALNSTSGTTGLPKAAIISHQNVVAQNIITQEVEKIERKPYVVSQLICLPIFHAFAAIITHVAPLRDGHATYIMRRFDLQQAMKVIHQFAVTETAMVPPMMLAIAASSREERSVLLQSLRYIRSGGAPLDRATLEKMYQFLSPNAVISQLWGMTECGFITSFQWPERDDTASVGRLLPSTEVKIVDEFGRLITDDNHQGEAFVRNPALFRGYLANPSATAEAFDSDGWLKTGDLVYCDNGKWYIGGRKKVGTIALLDPKGLHFNDMHTRLYIFQELIKVRGWQVSPSELEAILLGHPQIADVAVIGVVRNGNRPAEELPRAYVVRKCLPNNSQSTTPGGLLSEDDVKAYITARVIRYKALDGGVQFVEKIPRTPSGKIIRRILKAQADIELAQVPDEHEEQGSLTSPSIQLSEMETPESCSTTSSPKEKPNKG